MTQYNDINNIINDTIKSAGAALDELLYIISDFADDDDESEEKNI